MDTEIKLPRREKTGIILRYLRGNWGFFVAAITLAYLNTICNAVIPQVIRVTVDSVLDDKAPDLPAFIQGLLPLEGLRATPLRALWAAAGAVVLAALVRGICIYGMRINLAKGSEGFVKKIRDDLYSHILRLSLIFHLPIIYYHCINNLSICLSTNLSSIIY